MYSSSKTISYSRAQCCQDQAKGSLQHSVLWVAEGSSQGSTSFSVLWVAEGPKAEGHNHSVQKFKSFQKKKIIIIIINMNNPISVGTFYFQLTQPRPLKIKQNKFAGQPTHDSYDKTTQGSLCTTK